MKRSLLNAAVVLGIVLGTQNRSHAGLAATLVDSNGNANSATVAAGATFDVLVELATTDSLVSGQFTLADLSSSGLFTLESVAFNGSLWDTSAGVTLDPSIQAITSLTGFRTDDIGSIANDLALGTGVGTIDIATLTLSIDAAAAAGTYLLNLDNLVFGDTNFDQIAADGGQAYEMTVVPLPGAGVLMMIGLLIVGVRRRRSLQ